MTATTATDWWAAIAASIAPSGGGGGGGSVDTTATKPGLLRTRALRRLPWMAPTTGTRAARASPDPPAPAATDPPYFTVPGTGTPQFLFSAEDWGVLPNASYNHGGDTTATWDDYFSHRAAQGYNCVQTNIFGYGSVAGFGLDGAVTPEGGDVDGVYPFNTNSNDPSNANNSTWWTRRDNFFAKARLYGFRVILNITTPNINAGTFLNSWTTAQWQAWGTKIGTYLAGPNLDHVLIIVADDYFGTKDAEMNAMLTNIRAAGATQPIAIQWYQETSSRRDIYTGNQPTTTNNFSNNADYNFGYSYNVWYDVTEKMGLENSTLTPIPYITADGTFLNTGGLSGLTDKQLLRRQVWWAISSGAKGVQVGDNNVWTWSATALTETQTNTFYTAVVPAIATYVRSLPNWHKLIADTSSQLVTAGRGTHASPLVSGGSGGQYLSDTDSYVTASRTADGTLAVIYMSHGSTITIDESKMVAGYTATWVDPKTCATSATTPGPTYNSTAKGTNSDGQNDWVLVLAAPSTALTVAVDTAVLSLTGVDPTAAGSGAATTTLDVAALALTGVDPGAAGTGAASQALDVAALTLTGITPTASGSGSSSTALDVATLTLTGVDPTAAGTGASSTTLDVAALTLTGVDPAAARQRRRQHRARRRDADADRSRCRSCGQWRGCPGGRHRRADADRRRRHRIDRLRAGSGRPRHRGAQPERGGSGRWRHRGGVRSRGPRRAHARRADAHSGRHGGLRAARGPGRPDPRRHRRRRRRHRGRGPAGRRRGPGPLRGRDLGRRRDHPARRHRSPHARRCRPHRLRDRGRRGHGRRRNSDPGRHHPGRGRQRRCGGHRGHRDPHPRRRHARPQPGPAPSLRSSTQPSSRSPASRSYPQPSSPTPTRSGSPSASEATPPPSGKHEPGSPNDRPQESLPEKTPRRHAWHSVCESTPTSPQGGILTAPGPWPASASSSTRAAPR
jgi:hypothetical protein